MIRRELIAIADGLYEARINAEAYGGNVASVDTATDNIANNLYNAGRIDVNERNWFRLRTGRLKASLGGRDIGRLEAAPDRGYSR